MARRAALWAGLIGGSGTALDRAAALWWLTPRLFDHDPFITFWLTTWWDVAEVAATLFAVWLAVACGVALRRPGQGRRATIAAGLFLLLSILRASAEGAAFLEVGRRYQYFGSTLHHATLMLESLVDWLAVLLPAALVVGTAARAAAGRTMVLAAAGAVAAARLAASGTVLYSAHDFVHRIGFANLGVPSVGCYFLIIASMASTLAASAVAMLGAWRAGRANGRAAYRAALLGAGALAVAAWAGPAADAAVELYLHRQFLLFHIDHGPLWAYAPAALLLATAVPAAVVLAFRD